MKVFSKVNRSLWFSSLNHKATWRYHSLRSRHRHPSFFLFFDLFRYTHFLVPVGLGPLLHEINGASGTVRGMHIWDEWSIFDNSSNHQEKTQRHSYIVVRQNFHGSARHFNFITTHHWRNHSCDFKQNSSIHIRNNFQIKFQCQNPYFV